MDGRGLDAALLALAKRQNGVVSRSQVLRLGATEAQIRHRLEHDGWRRWLPSVLRAPWAIEDFSSRATAALLWAGPDALLSHFTAAHLWGLSEARVPIHLSVGRRLVPPATWVVPHCVPGTALSATRRRCRGLTVTSPARTLVDVAALVDDVEELAECALREKLLSPADLTSTFEGLAERGRPGVAAFRRFLARRFPDAHKVESLLEHRALRLFAAAKLPSPVCQHPIRLGNGRTARVDFAWPAQRVVVEADGHATHSSRRDWKRDLERHNALLLAGWKSLRLTWEDTHGRAPVVVRQLATLLAANQGSNLLP